jgi:hypothetical protein
MSAFEDNLQSRPVLEVRPGTLRVHLRPEERDSLVVAVQALREIAAADELVNENEDVFAIHALRRCQAQAQFALRIVDGHPA